MEFRRINALPQYVFGIMDALKIEARRAVVDVVDLGFGNPDVPSPDVAVDKLVEAVRNPRNHRYSASRGIPKLRMAIADLYQRKFGVILDPETQVCSTIGAKEGFSHLMWVLLGPGDAALVPSPSYPIHIWGPILAGAEVRHVRLGPEQNFFDNLLEAWEESWPRPRVIVLSFPHNPTTACVDLEFMQRMVDFAREHDVLLVHDFAVRRSRLRRLRLAVDPAGAGRDRRRSGAVLAHQVVLDGGMARRLPARQRRRRRRAGEAQELPRLRHVPADPDRRHRHHERAARLPE
jgi:alanine-synthesizing transaminase